VCVAPQNFYKKKAAKRLSEISSSKAHALQELAPNAVNSGQVAGASQGLSLHPLWMSVQSMQLKIINNGSTAIFFCQTRYRVNVSCASYAQLPDINAPSPLKINVFCHCER